MGDLESFMDESFLSGMFTQIGLRPSIKSIKIIKDKATNSSSGYGFIEFNSHETAQSVLDSYNGTPIPGTKKNFVMKWGAFGAGGKPQSTSGWKNPPKVSVFVGDLDQSVTDKQLLQFFAEKYPSAYFARIIYDPVTKYSKSYGFVEFGNAAEAQKAITETTGMLLAGRMIRVSNANSKQEQQATSTVNADIHEDPETAQLALLQKQQLYQYYCSIVDDPLMKMEYQRQLEQLSKMDLLKNAKKRSLKNELEGLRSLELGETHASEPFLEDVPSMVAYKGRLASLTRIFG